MEDFRERQIARSTTLADLTPVSVGRVLKPLGRDDDLLAEMLDTLADLTPVSVGRVLKPLGRDDDLLAEMLEDDRA